MNPKLNPHLRALENEAIHIFREVTVEAENPVLLYSIGKDSSALLHLARKAFHPDPVPFPLLHIDTGWKFAEMITFRDQTCRAFNLNMIVHTNQEGVANNVTPFTESPSKYTDVMKTQALRQALDQGGYDAAIGGARRDEEASRAKERIFSFRNKSHRWDPRRQRPELWSIYNGRVETGQSVRVFPLSNWTEFDVWSYIKAEEIEVVPLYFAKLRPFVERAGLNILAEDPRLEILPGEQVLTRSIRFRSLGCFPLTGAVESQAETLDEIIEELAESQFSERQTRAIDHDSAGSMEKKKRNGYF